jgi:hypothetical protein
MMNKMKQKQTIEDVAVRGWDVVHQFLPVTDDLLAEMTDEQRDEYQSVMQNAMDVVRMVHEMKGRSARADDLNMETARDLRTIYQRFVSIHPGATMSYDDVVLLDQVAGKS